ncbi:MAG: extracellular solute-binding protein [Butyrivibrio sp.]|nr:extracellular solute-binding protein [Butyrivibrio sp.]
MKATTLKKLGAAIISVLMVTSCASCGFLERKGTDDMAEHASDPDYITCMVWDRDNLPEGKNFDDNALANWIREQVLEDCGVEVHFMDVPRADSDSRIQRMVDDGTAPDIIFTYSSSLFGYMTKQSKVSDLTEAIKNEGANIQEYVGDVQYMGTYNDRQVAIMGHREFKLPRHVAYIRADWCRALGMDIPSTKEELIAYLYAVKKQNPGGVKNVIPWAMGGDVNSEKFYQNFVTSYVSDLSERDAFIYSERFMILADGADEGLRTLNKLYNDEIITLDFTADSDNSDYYKAIKEGRAGFFVDDNTAPFSSIEELKKSDPTADVQPVLCFDIPGGGYRNICEPEYGLYIMVPNTGKKKIDSVVKYLNWLADPLNAEEVFYTPDHLETEDGAPFTMNSELLSKLGYSGTPNDYCIVNKHFDFMDDKELQVSAWTAECNWEEREWFERYYDICTTGQYEFPTSSVVLEADSKYRVELDEDLVEYAYNLICCPTHEFDMHLNGERDVLNDKGLSEVLDERAAYYDSGKLRIGK